MKYCLMNFLASSKYLCHVRINEPRHEKILFSGVQPGKSQISATETSKSLGLWNV